MTHHVLAVSAADKVAVVNALASGLVVEEGDEWRIGPRADAITTPADGPHMAAARDALDEARLTLRLASLPAR